MIDLIGTISTGLTVLGVGQSVYEWITGRATNKEVAKLSKKIDKLEKLGERLYYLPQQEVHSSGGKIISDVQAIKAAAKSQCEALDDGQNLIISIPSEAPLNMQQYFYDGDPKEIIDDIQPLRGGANLPPDIYLKTKKVPITFQWWGQDFIGLMKVGYLKSVFGIEYTPKLLSESDQGLESWATRIRSHSDIKAAGSIENITSVQTTNSGKKINSVSELIKQAKQGGRLEIAAGQYLLDEPLTLDKSVELIGAGHSKTFIITAAQEHVMQLTLNKSKELAGGGHGKTFTFAAPQGHLIQFRGTGQFVAKGITFECTGDRQTTVVHISDGVVDIEGCLFTGGVWKENQGGSGLWITGRTRGIVKNNVFEANGLHGISLGGESQLRLEQNTMQNNTYAGIAYFDNAKGVAINNISEGNGLHGIAVQGNSQPTLKHNTIRNNKSVGISCSGGAGGKIENNVIEKNDVFGIQVLDGAWPRLEQNTIQNNTKSGIAYFGNSGGIAVANTCKENNSNGISVQGEAKPRLENNTLHNNVGYGIAIFESAQPTLTNNTFSENKLGKTHTQ